MFVHHKLPTKIFYHYIFVRGNLKFYYWKVLQENEKRTIYMMAMLHEKRKCVHVDPEDCALLHRFHMYSSLMYLLSSRRILSNLYNILLLDVSPPRVNRKVIPLERQNHQPREHRDNFDMMPPKYQQPWAGEDIFTGFSGCHTKYIIIIYWFLTLVFRLIFVDSINVFTAAK